MSPRSTTRPWYFWDSGSCSAFFEMTSAHQCCKVDFLFLFRCFKNILLVAPYFGQWPRWQLFELLPFFVLCCFRFRNFHRLKHGNKLVHRVTATHRIEPSLRDVILMIFWHSRFSKRFLVDSWASTMHACLVFWILLETLVSSSVSATC